MAEALLALGGNIGDAQLTIGRAIALLCAGSKLELHARSSDYLTAPWGVEDQPRFVNACILVTTALSPHALLERVQGAERALGRNRANERRWGPRLIDIDILTYDDLVLNEPDLILPHPHMFERAFVLAPLADIAAERVIAGVRVRDALDRPDTSGIERLPPARR